MTADTIDRVFIRDLGNGLILRHSVSADGEKLFAFNSMIHAEDPEKPDERVGTWARDLVSRPHPTFRPGDFTIVEEKATGRIVSCLNLISQTWTYAGIPFGVGRPELVGTLPEFRDRGLVRLQFDEIHRWSADRGELIQAITGIPYFYRQFGYEMAVDLDAGCSGFEMNLPKLKDGEAEPCCLRPASEADIPFMMDVYAHASKRSLLAAVWDEAIWRHALTGRSERSASRQEWRIIERTGDHEPLGYLAHPWFSWSVSTPALAYELKPGVSWLETTPSVARYLWEVGGAYAERDGKTRSAFTFWLGGSHPVYEIFGERLPRVRQPYAWYMRVPNLPAFVMRIGPVLEHRIAGSYIPGHSGELKISFYRDGLRIIIERGKISAVESWKPIAKKDEGHAAFPNLTFLQILFGYRSFDELRASYADCRYELEETRVVLSTLFPRKPSTVLGIA
jgi:hypothetical protein